MGAFTKSVLTHQTKHDGGDAVEVIDIKFQYEVEPGEPLEDVKKALEKRVGLRFRQMFRGELRNMRDRVDEAERWEQLRLFDDPLKS